MPQQAVLIGGNRNRYSLLLYGIEAGYLPAMQGRVMAFIVVIEIQVAIGVFYDIGGKHVSCHHGGRYLPAYFRPRYAKLPDKKSVIIHLVPFIHLAVFPELAMIVPENI